MVVVGQVKVIFSESIENMMALVAFVVFVSMVF